MNIKMKLNGVENLEREANKIIREVNDGKTKILKAQGKIVQSAIRQRSPKGPTGNLRRAIYLTIIPPSMANRRAVAFTGIRPRKAPHARLVEEGHGGPHPARPHPFFWPAVASVMDRVRNNIPNDLKKIIEG